MNLFKRFLKFIFLSLGYRIERIDRKRNDELITNSDYNPVVKEIKSYVDSRLNHHHRQTAVPISKDSLIFTHLLDGGRILLDPTDINITPHVIVIVIEWTPAIATENNISNHVTDAINFLESQDFKVYHIGERIWVMGSERGMGHFEELPIDGEVEISYEKFREFTKNNFSGDLIFKKA